MARYVVDRGNKEKGKKMEGKDINIKWTSFYYK